MQQQTQAYSDVRSRRDSSFKQAQPRRRDIFLHLGKTFKLIKGLMMDRRVPIWRKLFFLGSIGGLLVLLFFPDLLNEAFLSTVLPIVGTVAGVPIDAGFDWMAFSVVAVNLLKFFPAEMVAEHYRNVYR
ncbi:MAG: hypothetical protein M3Z24_15680 [Chloroflexota bacterium]|nr:hypothetical protein [Chloroflexota bacterium]